jgi:hypothetical protein
MAKKRRLYEFEKVCAERMLGVIMWVVKWGVLILIAKKCDKALDRLGAEVMTNSRLTQAKALGEIHKGV